MFIPCYYYYSSTVHVTCLRQLRENRQNVKSVKYLVSKLTNRKWEELYKCKFIIGFNFNLQLYTSRLCCWYLLEVTKLSKRPCLVSSPLTLLLHSDGKSPIKTKLNRMCVTGNNPWHDERFIILLYYCNN